MATIERVKAQIQSLIDTTNEKTGQTSADLTSAVNVLIDGYGTGSGGSLPAGTYYKTEKTLPKAKEMHHHFTFKGKKYLLVSDGHTSTKYIYEYSEGVYTLIQTIDYDSTTMNGGSDKALNYVELGDCVYFHFGKALARWNGETYERFTITTPNASYNLTDYPTMFKMNGKLYLYCKGSTSKYIYEVDFENKTYADEIEVKPSQYNNGAFNIGEKAYLIDITTIYEINSDFTFTAICSHGLSYIPKMITNIDNKLFYGNNMYNHELYTLDLDTLEYKSLGYNPFNVSERFNFDGVIHLTDSLNYYNHLSMHIVEES